MPFMQCIFKSNYQIEQKEIKEKDKDLMNSNFNSNSDSKCK